MPIDPPDVAERSDLAKCTGTEVTKSVGIMVGCITEGGAEGYQRIEVETTCDKALGIGDQEGIGGPHLECQLVNCRTTALGISGCIPLWVA